MSQVDLFHMSSGRTPWRRLLQLRSGVAPKEIEPEPVLSLPYAARNAEPPAFFSPWQRDEAKHRLLVLCEWLDDHLKEPAHVTTIGKGARRVTVFDSLAYSIYPNDRFVESGTQQDGHHEASNFIFEVGRPLLTSWWLRPLLRNLNLADTDQSDLIFQAAAVDDLAQWLSDAAYRLLLRNPVFQDFRRYDLPKLFKFPKEIYSIALASRTDPVGPLLVSRTLNNVWRNDRAFRQVARENSHLLPLLHAFVDQIPPGKTVQTKDPILALKSAIRDAGLSEATWRYVVRHGSRLFKIPWAITKGQERIEVAIRYLDALQSADLPPPPPPSVVKTFLHGYNRHRENDVLIGRRFQHEIDPVALRFGFLEADRRRQEGTVEGFAEEFLGVCWWSETVPYPLDDNQAKAGWQWFVRRWLEEEEAQALLENTKPLQWPARLEEFQMGQLFAVPMNSSEKLIRESRAMRNCLQTYIEDCARGDFEVYSVRDVSNGKRKGCIGIRFDSDGIPTINDVKGFANTPPAGNVLQIASDLFRKLQMVNLK